MPMNCYDQLAHVRLVKIQFCYFFSGWCSHDLTLTVLSSERVSAHRIVRTGFFGPACDPKEALRHDWPINTMLEKDDKLIMHGCPRDTPTPL